MAENRPASGSAGRRTFAPVVLLGLAAGALTAVAAGRTWLRATGDAAGRAVGVEVAGSDIAPLALALALVALASWGVLLVTRATGRRIALAVCLLAVVGVVAAVAASLGRVDEAALTALAERGALAADSVTRTAWLWLTGLAAILQAALAGAALRLAGDWPTMSSRYDAPVAGRASAGGTAERDLWNALDEGVDPTESSGP